MRTPHSQKFEKWFSEPTSETDDNGKSLDNLVEQWKNEDLLKYLEEFEDIDSGSAWNLFQDKLNRSLEKPKAKVVPLRKIVRYAAIFILPLATAMYFFNTDLNTQSVQIKEQTIVLNVNNQSSVLLNQKESTIYDENNKAIAHGGTNNLTYFPYSFKNGQQIKKHSLKIPHGKTFQVTLSDGTKVYCDAGTTLTYPAQFEKDKIRKVQLEGQAFFDVTKSKKNPFVVQTSTMDITVLGTQFNVNAYADNKVVKTVLVEGSVMAYAKEVNDSVLLVPNQQVITLPASGKLQVTQVNAYEHAAWVTGKLVFTKVTFNDILKTLERKYSVQITNTNSQLGKQVFTAKFENESIEQVMEAFKSEADFKYNVKENKIIIK